MKSFNFTLLLLLSLFSCAQEPNEAYYLQKLKSVLDIEYSDNFQVILYESTQGPDDFEKFQLKYSEGDFEKIISQVDTANMDFDPNLKIYYYQTGNYRKGEAVMFYMDRQIVQYTFINSE